jgi:hypothetical protein
MACARRATDGGSAGPTTAAGVTAGDEDAPAAGAPDDVAAPGEVADGPADGVPDDAALGAALWAGTVVVCPLGWVTVTVLVVLLMTTVLWTLL